MSKKKKNMMQDMHKLDPEDRMAVYQALAFGTKKYEKIQKHEIQLVNKDDVMRALRHAVTWGGYVGDFIDAHQKLSGRIKYSDDGYVKR